MIKTEDKNSRTVISLSGKLDSLNATEIYEKVEKIIKGSEKDVVFDLEELEYISSAGLRVILMCVKDRKDNGKKVFIYWPKDVIDEVLRISGFYGFTEKTIDL